MKNQQLLDQIQGEMMLFESGSPKRIQHFLKVHSFASYIGRQEGLVPDLLETLELVAFLHDIGIKASKEKYGYCNGQTQEELGPPLAREILEKYDVAPEKIDRICYLIANHHSYDNIVGLDYQILVEADFLVNLYENDSPMSAVLSTLEKIFKTDSGKNLCVSMFQTEGAS